MVDSQRFVDIPRHVPFETEDVRAGRDVTSFGLCDYSVTTKYFNGLNKIVTVVNRQGIRVEIPKTHQYQGQTFLVRTVFSFNRKVKVDVSKLSNSSSVAHKALLDAIEKGEQIISSNRREYVVDYHISLQDIEGNGGGIYVSNLDIILSTLNDTHVPFHPFSEDGLRNNQLQRESAVNRTDSFGFTIKIIDTQNRFGRRFINVNGTVYQIPVIKNSTLPQGVYIVTSGPVDGDNIDYPKPVSERYDFETADEKIRMYKTAEAARTFGDEFEQREREIKEKSADLKMRELNSRAERTEKQHQFEEHKHELEREKTQEEMERKQRENEMSMEISTLKHQLAKADHDRNVEMAKLKDQYEKRSLERKETSELVKWGPTIVAGVATIFITFNRLKPV